MSKLLLVIGIVQIVAGVVILGMVAKDFKATLDNIKFSTVDEVNAFGPVLISLAVITNGVFGVMTMCCAGNKKMEIFYLMGACIAAAASGAMVWIYSILVYKCRKQGVLGTRLCFYSEEDRNIHITLMVFSILACAMSVFGMVSSSLSTCRKV